MAWSAPKIGALAEVASGNLTLAEPDGILQGDLMIACIGYRSNAAFTVPGDWNLVATQQSSGDTDATNGIASGVMMWAVRGASAPTLTFNRTAGNVAQGRIFGYSGNQRTSPFDTGSANTLAVASATVTTGTITTALANELIVAMTSAGDTLTASAFDAATDPTTASGATDTTTVPTAGTWIERTDDSTGTGADHGLAIADAIRAAAGATGTIQATISASARHVMIVAAFKIDLAPTVSPNTADATAFSTGTPTLEATGTDGNADDVRYNVQVDTVNTFDSGAAVIEDTYDEANRDTFTDINSGTQMGAGQSFQAVGGNLYSAKFYLIKSGTPTGTAVATLYEHQGTFGNDLSRSRGSALATSATFDVSTLTGSYTLIEFIFAAPGVSLQPGRNYIIAIEYTGGSGVNTVRVGHDASSPTHAGCKMVRLASGVYVAIDTDDLCFYVYTKDPLLNKYSGTDAGFLNTVSGGDTDPFNSGEKVGFTVQAANTLTDGSYYWRARVVDPNGGNTYSAFTAARSFTVTTTRASLVPLRSLQHIQHLLVR